MTCTPYTEISGDPSYAGVRARFLAVTKVPSPGFRPLGGRLRKDQNPELDGGPGHTDRADPSSPFSKESGTAVSARPGDWPRGHAPAHAHRGGPGVPGGGAWPTGGRGAITPQTHRLVLCWTEGRCPLTCLAPRLPPRRLC